MMTFGPLPSRRLGRSLGINNIPPKICSYACVYCQLGRTPHMSIKRQSFYRPEILADRVRTRVEEVRAAGEAIDYLSFVPDGEPTLDLRLGREIELLRPLGIDIGVISNASLIWREDVRDDLMGADWVSLKIDAVNEAVWRRIDRPHGKLELDLILDGILTFAKSFQGRLVTETMLVDGFNDGEPVLGDLARFLKRLQPEIAYLLAPTRPPAEHGVTAPDEAGITRAWSILSDSVKTVECLTGSEGDAFFSTGRIEEDLLSITSVHPMRLEFVKALLARSGADWSVVQNLVKKGHLVQTEYGGQSFFVRRLPGITTLRSKLLDTHRARDECR
ncbi:MAG: radical SAM protein [Acidobacteriota bacterium]